jgi:hypothetical protein
MALVQINEADGGRGIERNSLLLGDGAKCVVNVWQMICRDIVDKRAVYFIVANAAMQPAQKHDKLHGDGDENGQEVRQIGCHVIP